MPLLSVVSTPVRPNSSQSLKPLKYTNTRNTTPSRPTFQGVRFLEKTTLLEKLSIGGILGIFGLLVASQTGPGFSGTIKEAPTVQNTIGTVNSTMGPTLTVTQNGEVFNKFGTKMGSIDSEGKAFDGFGVLVGYGTDQGSVYTLNSKGQEQLIGAVGINGIFQGRFLFNETNFGLPGLTRAQQAGLAAILVK